MKWYRFVFKNGEVMLGNGQSANKALFALPGNYARCEPLDYWEEIKAPEAVKPQGEQVHQGA